MCRRHYDEFYSYLHWPSVYSSCGARPKTGTRFSWHTPDAHLIPKEINLLECISTLEQMPGYIFTKYMEKACLNPFSHLSDLSEQRISKITLLHLLTYTTTQHLYNLLIPTVHQCPTRKHRKWLQNNQNSHSGTDHY